MPRLTFDNYLKQRALLKLAWDEFPTLYSRLHVQQQWQLHAYYQPLHDFTDERLREHRAHIAETKPSLPNQAGRLYAQLHRVYDEAIEVAKARQHQTRPASKSRPARNQARVPAGTRHVTVRAVARPEPDLKKLSVALVEVAMQAMKDRHDAK